MSSHTCIAHPCPLCAPLKRGVYWHQEFEAARRQRRREEIDRRLNSLDWGGAAQTLINASFVDEKKLHAVQWSAFCVQWVAIAWCMLIGREK